MTELNHTVSIIIPVFNGEKTIKSCLDSVFESSYPYFECIVVDDHSTDGTLEVVKSYDVKTICLDKQIGAAHARNIGAEMASGNILLFIDADVTLYPDNLHKIINTFEEMPETSAIFGSYDDQPGYPNFLSQYRNLMHHFIHQTSREDASTFWSACGAIKKDVFFEIGKYNEKTRMMEDIELGYRLKANDKKIYLAKDLQVKHFKRYSFLKLLRSDLFDRAIPWTELMWKYRQFTKDLNLKIKHKLSTGILVLIMLFVLMGFYSIWFFSIVPFLFLVYLALNIDFYRFFFRKKGLIFSLKVIPFHMFYYCYSLLGYCIGTFKCMLKKGKSKG